MNRVEITISLIFLILAPALHKYEQTNILLFIYCISIYNIYGKQI
jgi:hypothetical protein